MRKYSGAVAARPRAGFGRVISRGGPNLVLTRVITALNNPPRYIIGIIYYNIDTIYPLGYNRFFRVAIINLYRFLYILASV